MVQHFEKKSERKIKRESKRQNSSEKNSHKPNSGASGAYYSFLTIVLLLCLVQISISAVLNVSKIISYNAKIIQITKTRNAAKALNEQLKDNVKNFSNVAGLEAIARNNLKMSGEDEVLVIINTPQDEEKPEKTSIKDFLKFSKNDN